MISTAIELRSNEAHHLLLRWRVLVPAGRISQNGGGPRIGREKEVFTARFPRRIGSRKADQV